jgi:hypothetical protein
MTAHARRELHRTNDKFCDRHAALGICSDFVTGMRCHNPQNEMYIPSPLFGAMDIYRKLVDVLRRALRMEQPLAPEELRHLAEAIIDYGRMIAHEQLSALTPPPYVIVEMPELVRRFRETTQTIKDALLLLNDMGRAEPVYRGGYWKLKLEGTFRRRSRGGDAT